MRRIQPGREGGLQINHKLLTCGGGGVRGWCCFLFRFLSPNRKLMDFFSLSCLWFTLEGIWRFEEKLFEFDQYFWGRGHNVSPEGVRFIRLDQPGQIKST